MPNPYLKGNARNWSFGNIVDEVKKIAGAKKTPEELAEEERKRREAQKKRQLGQE